MFNINNWKEPIYKDDLLKVILYGVLISIVSGLIAGVVDYLFHLINVGLSVSLLILVFGISYGIRRGYLNYHILYSVLSIPFMVIGLFFAHFALYLLLLGANNIFTILSMPEFYLSFWHMSVSTLISGFKNNDALSIAFGFINIVIYIFAFFYCYKLTRIRRK